MDGNSAGNKTVVVGVESDVSAQQSVMDQWLEMFAFLVHDLESPLASMKYLLRLLERGSLDLSNPRHRQMVASSRIAVERAESILYDTMAVAKSGRLGLPARLESLRLDEVIRDVAVMATTIAAENGISLVVKEPITSVCANIDPRLLKRSLDNLVFNAIRHTPEGGSVTISTEADTRSIAIHIRDSGIGFGDADPKELFERYGQIARRSQGTHRGVGLGLYFCRLAAIAMNGTVYAANHRDGGAVFTFCLPRSLE